ncbi:pentatricopeptide repeat-containing protein At4g13650-like [Selaginella moellendorffii]|uniref:pentatricopeptide repeat-containing protein At4g13650-like n=1 Tax=Selaginella moellendorffii TaxID=88036 RepID=UPI000D1CA099|nr:pentatricopeptide repeat-containing protein At4g13650-like [Selaginella moellendorffii]|eukprot:XP_024545081.1 pentatricopeptide repeat-containing protein At4g13650-like [Selaginella moellendorffii]
MLKGGNRRTGRRAKAASLQCLSDAIDSLEKRSSPPDSDFYAALVRYCGDCQALPHGRRVHAHLQDHGYGRNRFLGNLLIQMYGKCGSLADARAVFSHLPCKNRYSWAILMAACNACAGNGWETIDLFHLMDLDGIRPDTVNFVNALTACSFAGALAEGRALHARIGALGMLSDRFVACALISMYGRCKDLEDAKAVFDSMADRDLITWNAMLAAYAQNGHCKEALDFYRQFDRHGVAPDNVTYITLLYACSCLEDLEEGMRIHSLLPPAVIDEDIVLANALVTMYFRCQRMDLAEQTFERITNKDYASWNVMISGNAQCGQARNALALYRRMNLEGFEAGDVTFMSVLDACCLVKDLGEGRRVHAWARSTGSDQQILVGTNLVNMYGKCGSVEEAREVFLGLRRKTLVTWTAMIAAYAQNGHSREALDLFYELEREECGKDLDNIALITIVDACAKIGDLGEGRELHRRIIQHRVESDIVVCNALITMYNKCGSLAGAREIFQSIQGPNIISWNAMLASYCEHGSNAAALELFARMVNDGCPPDDITFVSILFACSHAGLFEQGWQHFVSMRDDFGVVGKFEHYVCMADLLGRSGWLDEAEVLLDGAPYRSAATAWNTLLSACKMHQNLGKGERIAERILELDPQVAGSYVQLSNMYKVSRGCNSKTDSYIC